MPRYLSIKKFLLVILSLFIAVNATVIMVSRLPNFSTSSFENGVIPAFSYESPTYPLVLAESNTVESSNSAEFWLNSGGLYYMYEGYGHTIFGNLSYDSYWRTRYARYNSLDTDNGQQPQNVFRLVTKEDAKNVSQHVYVRISDYHEHSSPNRNDSNGVFLMSKYFDGDNLYYAGIRVDGTAIIKKKTHGVYQTLDQKTIIDSKESYDRRSNPILLPKNQWIGLKSVTKNINDRVNIDLYVDLDASGKWNRVLSVQDKHNPIIASGHGGIRSDFMDLETFQYSFDDLGD